MTDLFDEVEEELRSERYATLFRRAAPWVIGLLAAVLLAFVGYYGFKTYQDHNTAKASAEEQKGIEALSQNDQTGAFAHFEAVVKDGVPAYRSLALMNEAGLRLAANKPEEAAALYDKAADGAPNAIFADLAHLKAALALLDTASFADIQKRLTPLTASKRPFAMKAREALAMAELMAGKTADARRDFNALSLMLSAPKEMRQRAQLAVALIDGGDAETAVKAVKAAATLPPSPQQNVPAQQAPGQGDAQQAQPGAAE